MRFQKHEYQLSQVAILPVEGIGAHGNFFIKISAHFRGPNLFVSARGYTPAMELPEYRGAFRFYGNVKLLVSGRQVIQQRLERTKQELWPDDKYLPIGSAKICVVSNPGENLSLILSAGYEFNGGVGFVTPIPPTGRLEIRIQEEW